jgi:2-haloacid dehalogenase
LFIFLALINNMVMNATSLQPPRLLLLDVYETILDMGEIERSLNQLMDSRRGYQVWTGLFMQYTFADNWARQFHDFSSIVSATLKMTARIFDRQLSEHDIKGVLALMTQLPIMDGVQAGLSGLSDHNYRIAALTNSTGNIVKERMERTGLISWFEVVLSAESVKKYKPAVEVYNWAASKLNLDANEILMVSAHDWDLAGADNAGMQTAYIKQKRNLLYPIAPPFTFTCKNLVDLCEQLAARFHMATE